MKNRNTRFLITAGFTMLAAFSLSACQQPALDPEHPINTGDRPRVIKNTTPVENVYPTLKLTAKNAADPNIPAESKEFQLKSQTSRYTNEAHSALEIVLSDVRSLSCDNQNVELQEGESLIKLTIESKDGKALEKGTYSADKYNISGSMITMSNLTKNEQKFSPEQFQSMIVTDLNKAIFRGNFKLAGTSTSLDGEFFTAICKN